jgi:integrase
MKVKYGAVERNIYAESRSNAVRFVVQVSPLPKASATFDVSQFDDGLQWARRKRIELLEQKRQAPASAAVVVVPALGASFDPAAVIVQDILDCYERRQLHKLSGAASEKSRLKRLAEWFGHYQLGQVTTDVLVEWQKRREAGMLGSGRRRADEKFTKHQRHYRLTHAENFKPEELPAPLALVGVSPQTVRHELVLLRRAFTVYFADYRLQHGNWSDAHPIMRIDLPERPEARSVRVDDIELTSILNHLAKPAQQAFVLFAVATTLRRGEVCSLLWEDVDWEQGFVKLRAPGHRRKTKIHSRDVPLMPAVLQLLRKLGPKPSGRIFSITPSGISQALRRAADRAGLREVRLHDMRREGISRLIELFDASLQTIVVFSGHADEKVLQEHYAHAKSRLVAKRLAQHPAAAALLPAT